VTLTRLRIDVVSDVVCPWCVIGHGTLERVIADYAGRIAVDLYWQPFELNPQMPAEGQDIGEHLREKYGATTEQSRATRERITERAAAVGFPLRYADGMRIYKTFAAHQLMAWATERGGGSVLMNLLFDAYFTRHENISDIEVLATVARRAGLDADEGRAALVGQRYADIVRSAEREWTERGVRAVPTFVFDSRGALSGAQDASVFARIFERLAGGS
jgi:predicted DsbA family dithiol-disulfide isomerase